MQYIPFLIAVPSALHSQHCQRVSVSSIFAPHPPALASVRRNRANPAPQLTTPCQAIPASNKLPFDVQPRGSRTRFAWRASAKETEIKAQKKKKMVDTSAHVRNNPRVYAQTYCTVCTCPPPPPPYLHLSILFPFSSLFRSFPSQPKD